MSDKVTELEKEVKKLRLTMKALEKRIDLNEKAEQKEAQMKKEKAGLEKSLVERTMKMEALGDEDILDSSVNGKVVTLVTKTGRKVKFDANEKGQPVLPTELQLICDKHNIDPATILYLSDENRYAYRLIANGGTSVVFVDGSKKVFK